MHQSDTGNQFSPHTHSRRLSANDRYECPVCRHGTIAQLALMDAYACDFCRHIFTANFEAQVLRMEDSAVPTAWRWNGRVWRSVRSDDNDLTILIWFGCLIIMALPPLLVWVPMQLFPPLEAGAGQWFPMFWLIVVAIAHLIIGGWLLAEHYQWWPYIAGRERWLRLRSIGER
jgi:hypothetical protein